MVLVPPNAAAARPPQSAEQQPHRQWQQRPAPLDPDLEARLRRQRAFEYGRGVRHALDAWYKRHSVKKEEQLAAQRERWEAERAARLARLAEKQQQLALQQARPSPRADTPHAPQNDACSTNAVGPRATGAISASPTHVKKHADARQGSLHASNLGKAVQEVAELTPSKMQQKQQKQQQLPASGSRHDDCATSESMEAFQCDADGSHAGDIAPQQAHLLQELSGQQAAAAPAEPLSELLADLLSAESDGDPFSIINIFIEEQLQLQRQAAAAGKRLRPAQLLQAATNPAICKAAGEGLHAAGHHAGAGNTAEEQHTYAGNDGRRQSDSENVPANVCHRRTSSMLLPRFDAAAAEPDLHAHGMAAVPTIPATDDAERGPAEEAEPAELQAAQLDQPHQVLQAEPEKELPSPAQLEQQTSSRHLYVQQWLHASAAELAAGGSCIGSSVAYSADPDHAAAEAARTEQEEERSVTTTSSGANTVQPKPPAVSTSAAQTSLPAHGANLAGSTPAQQPAWTASAPTPVVFHAAAAVAAPAQTSSTLQPAAASITSSTSKSASLVTSLRRPGAPLPSGSSSNPQDGSTTLSGSLDLASAPGTQNSAGPTPPPLHATPAPPSVRAVAAEPTAGSLPEQLDALQHHQRQAAALPISQQFDSSSSSNAEPGATVSHAQNSSGLLGSQVSEELGEGAEGGSSMDGGSAAAEGNTGAPDRSSRQQSPSEARSEAAEGSTQLQQQELPAKAASYPAALASTAAASEEAYSNDSDFESELGSQVEISYGAQYGSQPSSPPVGAQQSPAEVAAAAAVARGGLQAAGGPSSPLADVAQQQEQQQRPQRPRSPLHGLDDKYPGSPPCSPGRQLTAGDSRPLSPISEPGSRTHVPAAAAAAMQSAAVHAAEERASSQPGSQSGTEEGSSDEGGSQHSDGPYSLLRISTERNSDAANGPRAGAGAAVDVGGMPGSPCGTSQGASEPGSPAGTPRVASPVAADASSCPGSARVEDSTVAQSEAHVHSYLGEVMAYFWQERAEGFAAGQMPPLDLAGYLALERRRAPCGDPQHIFNKLLFDAANEALAVHYQQALDSYTGRLAPRLALLSREKLEQNVVQRVLRWAAAGASSGSSTVGGIGGGTAEVASGGVAGLDVSALLAEDALEEERVLRQLAGAVAAELEAAHDVPAQQGFLGAEAKQDLQAAKATDRQQLGISDSS